MQPEAALVVRMCPACQAQSIQPTLDTLAGTYCHCISCGHWWHWERRQQYSAALPGGRQKTDGIGEGMV
jgi:hypothetical protein